MTRNHTADVTCKEKDTAVFMHIGMINPTGARSATKSMVRALKGKYCNAYYTTSDGPLDSQIRSLMIENGFIYKPASPFFKQLFENGTLSYEFPTLQQLWYHCKANRVRNVIYLQALGSHKAWSLRRQFTRRVLQGQVLYDGEIECKKLRGRWHCGPNPNESSCWEHYSGNFWRASCEHVNTLDDPSLSSTEFERAMHMGAGHGDSTVCSPKGPLGRYWAEAWITQGYVNREDKLKLPLVGIQGVGDANAVMRIIHFLFFKHNVHLLYPIDAIARLTGTTW